MKETMVLLLICVMFCGVIAIEKEQVLQRWNSIVFVKAGNIWVVGMDGNDQTKLTNGKKCDHPVFSPDGKKIAFNSVDFKNGNIYIMDVDGSGIIKLTNNSAFNDYPKFSPNGMRIAYMSNRDGSWEIYIMDIDGSNQTQLTINKNCGLGLPIFSNDGNKMAFVSSEGNNGKWTNSINILNLSNNNIENTINNAAWWGNITCGSSFSDNSNDFIYSKIDDYGYTNLYITDLTDNTSIQLDDDYGCYINPLFSASSSCIAYVNSSTNQLIIRSIDYQSKSLISDKINTQEEPEFSPDGKYIVYVADINMNWEIFISAILNKEQKRLTNGGGSSPSFAPMLINGKLLDYYGHWHEIGE